MATDATRDFLARNEIATTQRDAGFLSAIEANNTGLLPIPRNGLTVEQGNALAGEDLALLRLIRDPEIRRDAVKTMAHTAGSQEHYRSALLAADPEIAKEISAVDLQLESDAGARGLDDLALLRQMVHQDVPPEVIAELAEDRTKAAGGPSMVDTWLALKAEAERHGYVPLLELPNDSSNLEISYTDPRGGKTLIYSTLYPGGRAQTIIDGAQVHPSGVQDMELRTDAVRGAIMQDMRKKGLEVSATRESETPTAGQHLDDGHESPRKHAQQDLMPSWHGEWQSNLEGSADIRPVVATIESGIDALDYLPGIQISQGGGEPHVRWGDEVQSSKKNGIAEAAKMVSSWHHEEARVHARETAQDLARAIVNEAEKLNIRDVDSMRPDEAAALVKADLFILDMVGHSDRDARNLAVGALAEISQRHSAYKEALIAQDPSVASETQQAIAEDERRVVAKEDRKLAAHSLGAIEGPLNAKAGMSAALDKTGEVYLVDLDQAAVHLVSHEGQRIVVGTGERGKGLFMTRPDGHFEIVGSTSRDIEEFIERNQLYALEGAAVSVLARDSGIDGYLRSGEESPLAVEIRNSRGDVGYAVAVTGPDGNPGVQFRWSLVDESDIYSSVGELELAGHALQLRADAIFDSIELAQISGLPGRSIERHDLETNSIVNEDWQRIDSVQDAWMKANYETGMAEVKEDGTITSVTGLAAISSWAEEHGATPVDKERLVDLDLDAARGRTERERELDPTAQLEEIQLRAEAPRIGSTMPRPDWIETMKLLKLKDPDAPVKVFIPKSGTEYGGQVLMVTDTHAIQRVGKGIAIAHDLNKLSNRSSIVSDLDTGKISRGMEMRVDYGLEKGSARFFSVEPQQATTMRRDLTSWAEKNITNDRARQVYLKHLDSAVLETPKSRGTAHRQLPMSSTSSRDVQHSR